MTTHPTPPAAWPRRAAPYLLAGILLLGFGVRVRQYLAAPSFWYDEAYILVNVFEKSFAELAGPLRCEQAAPPLFLWSLRSLYVAFGGSEWSMRFPAFLASILALAAMIPLARSIAGERGWIWAVGFAAVCQPAIFHTVCVKPYAGDLLATIVVFLVGSRILLGVGNWRWIVAIAVAAVMPWYSYPSIFALGGVCAAIGTDAIHRRSWRDGAASGLVSLAWIGSFGAAWFFIGRHQRSDHLATYWQHGFVDFSSVGSTVKWLVHLLYHVGDYGTTGMGVPLLILGCVGAVALGRRSPALLMMLVGQLAFAGAASAARMYPLDDRLIFFAVPNVWILAAVGVDAILASRIVMPRRTAIACLLLVPLLPGVARYAYWTVAVQNKVEFRQAFAYVEERAQPDDLWWVSQPEVYEVYFRRNRARLLEAGGDPKGRHVWVVATAGSDPPPLREQGFVTSEQKSFKTIQVELFVPNTGK